VLENSDLLSLLDNRSVGWFKLEVFWYKIVQGWFTPKGMSEI
jgi:hypothetical protein